MATTHCTCNRDEVALRLTAEGPPWSLEKVCPPRYIHIYISALRELFESKDISVATMHGSTIEGTVGSRHI